jgi:hypothetical protein
MMIMGHVFKLLIVSLLCVCGLSGDEGFIALKKQVIRRLEGSWCSAEKAEKMMDLVFAERPQVCVEIGVFTGWTVLPVAATLRYLGEGSVYAVDAWSNREAVRGVPMHDPNYSWWATIPMAQVKEECENLLTEWNLWPYCWIVHATSAEAVDQVPPIDFLHLDGHFSEAGALLDTELYLPKVRSGGYILLSNMYFTIGQHHTKMASMWRLMDECDVVWELDGSNVVLFRKN